MGERERASINCFGFRLAARECRVASMYCRCQNVLEYCHVGEGASGT